MILFQARNPRGSVIIENLGTEPHIRTWLHITQPDAFGFERPTLSMNWPKDHPEARRLLNDVGVMSGHPYLGMKWIGAGPEIREPVPVIMNG